MGRISNISPIVLCGLAVLLWSPLAPSTAGGAEVLIGNLVDFNFPTYSGSGDLSADSNVCVYSDTGHYVVTVTGDGPGSSFAVTASGNALGYSAYWNDQTGTSGQVPLTSGSPLTNQNGYAGGPGCGGGNNANLEIEFREEDLLEARPGQYSGSVSIMVEPS